MCFTSAHQHTIDRKVESYVWLVGDEAEKMKTEYVTWLREWAKTFMFAADLPLPLPLQVLPSSFLSASVLHSSAMPSSMVYVWLLSPLRSIVFVRLGNSPSSLILKMSEGFLSLCVVLYLLDSMVTSLESIKL